MGAPQPTILVLDDEKNIRRSIEIALEQEGMHVLSAHDPAAALRMLSERVIDALILDIRLGEVDGLAFFRKLQAEGLSVPTVFISGHATLSEAAQAVRIGGFDFLEKPFSAEKILVTVQRCLEHASLRNRLARIDMQDASCLIVGDSPAIRQIIAEALRVAATHASVLIAGESGTGKELVANTIHAHSARKGGPFVKVNCSAIPENLIESELFGYERGAFTGATSGRRGLFESAHRGTLFLDEIADLSLSAQAKILRVVQSGEVQKLGSERTTLVDVRIVAGTHKDLRQAVVEGRFREDLFFRLSVVPLRVPPLRERAEDIPLLVSFFIKQLCEKNNLRQKEIDDDVFDELKRFAWPGNVRELGNVVERMLIMSGERITIADLPEEIFEPAGATLQARNASTLKEFRDKAERDFILEIIRKHAGNISQSALELGVRRTYLHRRLAQLGITKKDYFGS
jgi:two-component system, NtrC family, nitrogen regulation response regulator NtrX